MECFLSDYHTSICPECGCEQQVSIVISPKYSSNQTLSVGYSRSNRFHIILDQLLNPLIYGCPNSRVLCELNNVDPGLIKNGVDMIEWLTSLQVPDKRYQCVHYYFAWYSKGSYTVPQIPSKKLIRDLEMKFAELEAHFRSSTYQNQSFFSYNWLLCKLLEEHSVFFHYNQFVKRIKCKHRHKKYLKMYISLKNASNVSIERDARLNCQKPPDELPGDDFPHHRRLMSYLSSRVTKTDQNTTDRST
jgi:hypothetical protein